jgi:hypothetical protein
MRKRVGAILAVAAVGVGFAIPAGAGAAQSLPEGCQKVKGEVQCFDGPGQNQGGVGTTTTTNGNATNDNPKKLPPPDCNPEQSVGVCG